MIKGNKGEWSEVYTLLKLLGDGKLHAADSDLNKMADVYYPLLKILREESNGSKRNYIYDQNIIKIIDGDSNRLMGTLSAEEFSNKADLLLNSISKGKRSFSVSTIEPFLKSIDVSQLKAKSTDKRDISIIVHDKITGMNPVLGFSIKSRLGNASTLLNSNKDATNFIYRVNGDITDSEIDQINNINTHRKIKDRIDEIYLGGHSLEYIDMANDMFKTNLQLIDSNLPLIMGEIVLDYFKSNRTSLIDLVANLESINPCNFNNNYNHSFYKYKVKNLLTDSALGMTPSSMWGGHYDATGGYIVVKEDGELVCYHVYNRNEFQNYLLNNTALDSPSSSRHDYGMLYKENQDVFLKLNLQIRFKH